MTNKCSSSSGQKTSKKKNNRKRNNITTCRPHDCLNCSSDGSNSNIGSCNEGWTGQIIRFSSWSASSKKSVRAT